MHRSVAASICSSLISERLYMGYWPETPMRRLLLLLAGLVLLLSACASGSPPTGAISVTPQLPANPPHGQWVWKGSTPSLLCDASYYQLAGSSTCLQPRAFVRPARTTDVLPPAFSRFMSAPRLVRRVAELTDPRGHV